MANQEIKYYLKCDTCGYLTEIDSENHTWCYNCTTRFPNYYKGWKPSSGDKSLEKYKNEVCIPYSSINAKLIVTPNNKKAEIINPSKEQIKRRVYLKDGFPLDRGGFTEWDFRQVKMYLVGILIIFGSIAVIAFIFNLFV